MHQFVASLPPHAIVLHFDAYDVLFNAPPTAVAHHMVSSKMGVIFSGEKGLSHPCPPPCPSRTPCRPESQKTVQILPGCKPPRLQLPCNARKGAHIIRYLIVSESLIWCRVLWSKEGSHDGDDNMRSGVADSRGLHIYAFPQCWMLHGHAGDVNPSPQTHRYTDTDTDTQTHSYTVTELHRHTDTQTQTQTHRHRHRQRHRQRQRHTYTYTVRHTKTMKQECEEIQSS